MTTETARYNPIFTRFVAIEQGGDKQLEGLVAYGLYKVAKREWALDVWDRQGRKPSEDELSAYSASWTESRLKGLEQEAQTVLARFAESVVEANEPSIREDALKGTTSRAILQNMSASFLYTLLLLLLVVILAFFGVDILGLIEKIRQLRG